jgi:hypothetical protein
MPQVFGKNAAMKEMLYGKAEEPASLRRFIHKIIGNREGNFQNVVDGRSASFIRASRECAALANRAKEDGTCKNR